MSKIAVVTDSVAIIPRTMATAIKGLIGFMKEKVTGTPLHAAVMRADNPQGVAALKKDIEANFECNELLVSEVTPIIGTHFGPGGLSIAFYNE
jgi:fatty acid-binding protein DegV